MEKHHELADRDFVQQFEEARLDPSLFSHEAHLRLAWIYIRRFGVENALIIICNGLKKYVKEIGAEDKFNLTLTIAATRAMDHFMRKSIAEHFQAFIQEYPQLKTRFRELMASHYRTNIFTNPDVKNKFLEPDLLPFD